MGRRGSLAQPDLLVQLDLLVLLVRLVLPAPLDPQVLLARLGLQAISTALRQVAI